MKKLRVGFLVDNMKTSQYVFDLISFVLKNENFDTPYVITGYKTTKSETFSNKFKNLIKTLNVIFYSVLYKIIKIIEFRKVKQKFPKYKCNLDLTFLEGYELLKVNKSSKKSTCSIDLSENDLFLISQCNLDCIVQCSSEDIVGEILNLTKFGVISSFYGDNYIVNERSVGFHEVYKGKPMSSFTIRKLNQYDDGDILFIGKLMTSGLWLQNNAQLIEKMNTFLTKILLDLAVKKELPLLQEKRPGKKLSKNRDSSLNLLNYLIKNSIPKIINFLISKFMSPRVIRYSIAYTYHNDHTKSLDAYKEIPNPKGRFLADPFVFEHNKSNYIFVEDLFYSDEKGRISAIKIEEDKHEFLGIVLEEKFHLSYPFIFKEEDDIYMIPESHKNNDIRLYKCLEFPMKLKLEKVMMSDISAADTTVIKKNNLWFMLTNICSAGFDDHQSELHIFYSEDLKSNSWNSIRSGNPVIFDPLKGRNGGIFYHKDNIYRINQVHEHAFYGKSFKINEILNISSDEYIEKELMCVDANFRQDIISTHHFSANAEIAAVDYTRYERLSKILKT